MGFVVFLLFVGVTSLGAVAVMGRQMLIRKERSPGHLYLAASLVAVGALAVYGAIVLLVSPFP